MKTNRQTSTSSCDVTDECVSKAVQYMKIQKDKVANYQRQAKRIIKQNSTGSSKSGKKDVFKSAMTRLIQVGGGNESAPSCLGSTDNAAAKQIKNLTETLKMCSDNIKKACDPGNLPQPNMTAITVCNKTMASFSKKLEECRKKSGKEACTCWNSTELSGPLETIKGCSLSKEASAMAKGIKTCRSAFSTCRKYEDDISPAIFVCNINPKALLSQLKSMSTNVKSLKTLKTIIDSLTSRKFRYTRSIKNCDGVLTKVDETTTLTKSNPASSKIKKNVDEIQAARDAKVTCSTEQKNSLKTKSAAVDSAIAATEEKITTVKKDVEASTGKAPSDDDINNAEACATDSCNAVAASAALEEAAAATTTTTTTTTTTPTVATKASGKKKRRQAVEDILKSKVV